MSIEGVKVSAGQLLVGAAAVVIELQFHVIELVAYDFMRASDTGRLELLAGVLFAIALGCAVRRSL